MTTSYWQQSDKANAFVEDRRALIPLIEEQEQVVRMLIAGGTTVDRFLDLGCGAGAMARLVLDVYPGARGVLVDFSEPMLAGAREALSSEHRLLEGDLSDPEWLESVTDDAPFGLAISGLAIHHLDDGRKRALFAEVFDLLTPGAMFVNLEHVATREPGEGLLETEFVSRLAEQATANGLDPDVAVAAYRDTADEDILASPEAQCRWLEEAGFEQADQYFRWFELAVIAAVKPKGSD